MKDFLHAKVWQKDRVYGNVTVGSKGQVVIPAAARKDLGINTGDSLLVVGKMGKALGLIKAEELAGFVTELMKEIEHSGHREFKKFCRAHLDKLFRSFSK